MGLFLLGYGLLDFPIDWNDEMTLFLILFSAGLLCVICAVLLAVYLLKSDRFLDKPETDKESLEYPSYDELDEESRLSKAKNKISACFGRIKRFFKGSPEEFDLEDYEPKQTDEDFASEPPDEEPPYTDDERNLL